MKKVQENRRKLNLEKLQITKLSNSSLLAIQGAGGEDDDNNTWWPPHREELDAIL